MRCVQRRACPRPLHLNLFPPPTPLINYLALEAVGLDVTRPDPRALARHQEGETSGDEGRTGTLVETVPDGFRNTR